MSTTLSVSVSAVDEAVRLPVDDGVVASDGCPPDDGSTSSSFLNLTNDCDSRSSVLAHRHAHTLTRTHTHTEKLSECRLAHHSTTGRN